MYYLLLFFVFVLGAVIGSFINVIVLRSNTGESFLRGRSRCLFCGEKLRWYENIPLASFIVQGGRCRHCRSRISWQYPLVEGASGFLFLAVFLKFRSLDGWFLFAAYYFIVFSILLAIAVYDLRHKIIPDSFVYLFILLSSLNFLLSPEWGSFSFDLKTFLAGIFFFSFFAALWLFSRGRAMGFGDAKLALGIGWLLGLEKGLTALGISLFLPGLLVIFVLLPLKLTFGRKIYFFSKIKVRGEIPFAPLLILGCLTTFFFGDPLYQTFITYLPTVFSPLN